MASANLTRAETAERSRAVTVRSYRVELDLRGAPDAGSTCFATTTTVEFTAAADATWLDFLGAGVESVVLNGEPVPVRYDGARIALSGLREHNVVTVVAAAAAFANVTPSAGLEVHAYVSVLFSASVALPASSTLFVGNLIV